METGTRKSRTVRPVTKAWNVVKNLDDAEKLELMSMLLESVKPNFTKVEEQEMAGLDKDFYTPEEAYEIVMKDVKSIYGVNDAV